MELEETECMQVVSVNVRFLIDPKPKVWVNLEVLENGLFLKFHITHHSYHPTELSKHHKLKVVAGNFLPF